MQFQCLIHCPFHVTLMQWFIKTSSIYWGASANNLKGRLRLLHSSWIKMAPFKWLGLLVQLSLSWPDRQLRRSSKTRRVSAHPTPVFVLRNSNNALVNTCPRLLVPSFSMTYRHPAVHSNEVLNKMGIWIGFCSSFDKILCKNIFLLNYHFLRSDIRNFKISFECLLVSGSE